MDTPLGSVLYITLGCAENEVDTDRMRSLLTAAGYEEAFDPQDADIAIVNTCSFLASATSESIETTLELANEVQDGVRSCPIVMCGCVPSRYGDDLPDEAARGRCLCEGRRGGRHRGGHRWRVGCRA